MKLSIISIVSLLAVVAFGPSACAMSNFVVQISSNNDDTATTGTTTHPVQACERETNINIEEKLNEAILETVDGVSWEDINNKDNESDRRLNSRFGGVSSFCFYYCQGFKQGSCQVIYPRCYGMRRQLEDEESQQGIAKLEDNRMLSLDDFIVEEERGAKCAQAAIVSEATFQELAQIAESDECRDALLAEDKQYSCYNVLAPKF